MLSLHGLGLAPRTSGLGLSVPVDNTVFSYQPSIRYPIDLLADTPSTDRTSSELSEESHSPGETLCSDGPRIFGLVLESLQRDPINSSHSACPPSTSLGPHAGSNVRPTLLFPATPPASPETKLHSSKLLRGDKSDAHGGLEGGRHEDVPM